MDKCKVLFAASEAAPFARTGGLGDVLGALPAALAQLGHEVPVILPCYRSINHPALNRIDADWSSKVTLGNSITAPAEAATFYDRKSDVQYSFIRNRKYFDRDDLYRDPDSTKDYIDNDERFAFFCVAVLQMIRETGWQPDIIHLHDWQTALVPAYLKARYADFPEMARIKTVLTIHNIGYQGLFDGERIGVLGLPDNYFVPMTGPLEFYQKVNFLKAGIMLADAVTTVSPRYAQEIRSGAEFGCGLEGVLQERHDTLVGILNGVDYTLWSPSRDRKIPYRYSLSNLSGKRSDRVELLNRAGLPVREKTPVIGMVSRLADQKGWDLVAEAAHRLFSMNIQMIVLGTGDSKYHELLAGLQEKYPARLRAFLTFDDELAHWIEAGADMFLMPSRYEPCGLNQMYSLRYGTVPIVREAGGLADTVIDLEADPNEGTGFVFREYTAEAMLEAVRRAVDLFSHKREWMKVMKRGMRVDFSWERSAVRYSRLYQSLINDA